MSDMLELNCLVVGDDTTPTTPTFTRIITVDIAKEKKIGALKHAIKDQLNHIVNAHTLILWKVSIPVDESLDKNLMDLDLVDETSLSPVVRLAKVFLDKLEDEYLHIVARPSAGECICLFCPCVCRTDNLLSWFRIAPRSASLCFLSW